MTPAGGGGANVSGAAVSARDVEGQGQGTMLGLGRGAADARAVVVPCAEETHGVIAASANAQAVDRATCRLPDGSRIPTSLVWISYILYNVRERAARGSQVAPCGDDVSRPA